LSSSSFSSAAGIKSGGFFFGGQSGETLKPNNTGSTNTKDADQDKSKGGWKCACCTEWHPDTVSTCTVCLVPRVVPKTTAKSTSQT